MIGWNAPISVIWLLWSSQRTQRMGSEAILADLLRGPSLNVDETEARLCKEKANVWVYAGVNGTYYEYRDSRNGQFLTERFENFGGVLVSDFFTAYDSIACPQQKCV